MTDTGARPPAYHGFIINRHFHFQEQFISPSAKKEPTIESRVKDLEKSVNDLLSTVLTLTRSHFDSHTAFMHEIARLKEEVAQLKAQQ